MSDENYNSAAAAKVSSQTSAAASGSGTNEGLLNLTGSSNRNWNFFH